MTDIFEIRNQLQQRLKPHRYEHTLGVSYTAVCLAMRYEYDMQKAMLAGLLHDCAKCIPGEKQIHLCKKNHIDIRKVEKENPYKQMGLSYIQFANDYPEFFKILFMQQTTMNPENFIVNDNIGNDVIKIGQNLTHLTFEEQKKFHVKVWIFTHGIACLVATKTVTLKETDISNLLETSVREMLKGYLSERKENDEKCN